MLFEVGGTIGETERTFGSSSEPRRILARDWSLNVCSDGSAVVVSSRTTAVADGVTVEILLLGFEIRVLVEVVVVGAKMVVVGTSVVHDSVVISTN